MFNGNFPRLVIVSTGNGYDRDKKFDFSGTGTFHDKIFMACISLNNETIPHSTFGEYYFLLLEKIRPSSYFQ